MQTAVFSFNAIEMFCNQTIADELGEGQYARVTGKRTKLLGAAQVQRLCSTEEKIQIVLPTLLSRPSPRGLIKRFNALKRARDSTIHLKAEAAHMRKPDQRTLFTEFFALKPLQLPWTAIDLIAFMAGDRSAPWLHGEGHAGGNDGVALGTRAFSTSTGTHA